MKRNPPTYTTLATWHVPLAEFLEGEYSYQGVFSKGNIEIASTVKTMDIDQGRKVLHTFLIYELFSGKTRHNACAVSIVPD